MMVRYDEGENMVRVGRRRREDGEGRKKEEGRYTGADHL